MKVEQSRMVEDMQKMQEDFGMNMEDLRNQLLAAVMDMMQSKKGSRDLDALSGHSRPYDDEELIVIGNEITLLERPISRAPGDTRPVTPLPPKAKAQGRGKGLMEANASGHPVSFEANDMGQNVGQKDTRSNTGRSDTGRKGTGRNVAQNDMGQNDVGQDDIGWNMGQKNMRQNVQLSDTGQNDIGQNDMGQIKDEEIKKSMAKAETLPSDLDVLPEMIDAGEIKTSISEVEALPSPLDGPPEMANMGEIKDEEMKMRISKVKALPSPLDGPPEMANMGEIKDEEMKMRISKVKALPSPLDGSSEMASMGEIKDEEMKMRISKAPPDVQKKSLDGGFTASRMHPGAPVQWVQPVQGHPGSQNLWIPDKSVPGTSRHSQITPSTPPPSPGFSGHLPRAFKRHPCVPVQQHREPPATGYSRRSPLYCGGKHTTTYPVQPMEPLLPDPNKVPRPHPGHP
ncbi:uncharacterized protein M8220_010551 isoform 2-T2 [Acridotheres tristis]